MRESSFGKSKAKALNKFTHFTGPHVSGTGYVTNIYDHNLLKLKSGELADWYRLLSKQTSGCCCYCTLLSIKNFIKQTTTSLLYLFIATASKEARKRAGKSLNFLFVYIFHHSACVLVKFHRCGSSSEYL